MVYFKDLIERVQNNNKRTPRKPPRWFSQKFPIFLISISFLLYIQLTFSSLPFLFYFFRYSFIFSSKFFSSFVHTTCLLSVSDPYLGFSKDNLRLFINVSQHLLLSGKDYMLAISPHKYFKWLSHSMVHYSIWLSTSANSKITIP